MLERPLAIALLTLAVMSIPAVARQQTPSDPITALLAEVRQLRLAMERSLTVSPRIQLLTSRLSAQRDVMQPLALELSAIRQQLSKASANVRSHTARFHELEDLVERETEIEPERRKLMEREQAAMKAAMENYAAEEQDLRNREADLANALAVEQAHWNELTRRLDELERMLDRPGGFDRRP
jgi:hypothetical protein